MPKKSITVRIEVDVYRAVKAAAGISGKLMAQWVEDALRKSIPPAFRKDLKS